MKRVPTYLGMGIALALFLVLASIVLITYAGAGIPGARASTAAQNIPALGVAANASKGGLLPGPLPPERRVWRIVDSPNQGAGANLLLAVTASSHNDIWALGTYNTTPQGGRAQTQHWTSNGWELVPSPNVSSGPYGLYAADGVSGDDVWGIGSYYLGGSQYTLAEHWGGSAWEVVNTPNGSSPGGNGLNGVAARSTDDVWAVGGYNGGGAPTDQTLVLHWNGEHWSIAPSPNATGFNFLLGVSAVSGDDAWAVGFYAPDGQIRHGRTLTLHWNGQHWAIVPSPNPPNAVGVQLWGVNFRDSDDGWAVGYYTTADNVYHTLTLHWDGSAWELVPGYDEPGALWNELYSVAINNQEVWAVGGYSMNANPRGGEFEPPSAFPGAQTLILNWSRGEWHKMDSPNRDTGSELVSVTARQNRAWAVGSSVTGMGPARTLIEEYDPENIMDNPNSQK